MAGAIEKKKNETYDELVGSPATHIDARSSILSDIALSREFAQTFLQALCQSFGGFSLAEICEKLAYQRQVCYGAGTQVGFKKFSLPGPETVNGALSLTEANTSFFGYVSTTLDEITTINLSNTDGATQTIDGNTFSTYIGDYYLVRSRVSGELEPTSANLSAYTTPDGADIAFGNSVAWGSSVAGEEEANTWNYHWAKANVASVAVKNSGGVLELKTITLADHLTQGSNTDYTPVGPGFNQTFYLKRHADAVNTFTITGTTSINSVSITGVSEADMAKVKYGDVISGTGIPDDNVSILAVQTEKSTIRLSETGIATADGTITLTVNSVPVGQAAHDIFCQLKVSGEGLVANTSWTPVGDGAGNYAIGSEDDLCVADTDDFKGLLSFFNPDSPNNDLTKGASASYVSDGKEYGGTSYPDIEINPFFPSNQGTTADYATKGTGAANTMTGTQPTGLGNKDVWSGRFVRFDFERADSTGTPVGEYRYYLDNAEKFYYELPANGKFTCGTYTNQTTAQVEMPNFGEPAREIPGKTALRDAIDRSLSTSVTITGGTALTTQVNIPRQGGDSDNEIPADDQITYESSDTATSNPGTGTVTDGSFYIVESANNIVTKYNVRKSWTSSGSGTSWTKTYTYANQLVGAYNCVYNHVQKHLYEAMDANTDVSAVESALDLLQTSGVTSFRDGHCTSSALASGGKSDADFEAACATHATNGPDGTLTVMKSMQESYRAAFAASGRFTHPTGTGAQCIIAVNTEAGSNVGGTAPTGSAVNYFSFTHNSATVNALAQWESFSTAWTTLKGVITARIAEIDARIGTPIRDGTPVTGTSSSPGATAPRVRVKTLPPTPAAGQYAYDQGFTLVPYGRSIYNNVNHLLGQHVNLLGGIIKDIESLNDLVDMVKTARNKYEIYSGRDKVAGY